MAESSSAPNYTAAFVAYMEGGDMTEIARLFDIRLDILTRRSVLEDWNGLRNKAMVPAAQKLALTPSEASEKVALIQRNREANFAVAVKLRDDLVGLVDSLRAGTLKKTVRAHNRGSFVETEAELDLDDRVTLAKYAGQIADMTYAALGDRASTDKQDGPRNANSGTPAITIVWPGVVQRPRADREMPVFSAESAPVEQRIIDVEDISKTPAQSS